MSDCPKLQNCPFFNDRMENMPGMSASLKRRYCRGAYDACARYMVYERLGPERVPIDLFPNEADRALILIITK